MSQNALELHFGIGSSAMVDVVEVAWPGGRKSVLRDVNADQTITVREPGAGAGSHPARALRPAG
jgi:hypothetical protein